MTDEAPMTEAERLEEAKKRVAAKKAFFGHFFVFVIVNVVGVIVAGEDWLIVTLFWGIGVAVQAFAVFFQGSAWLKQWEHNQVQKEMAKTDPNRPAPAPPAAPPTTASDETQS